MPNLRKTFSKIYDEYIKKIYRFILLKVSSEDIAKDICSETFLKAWEAYKKDSKIENVQAFLYTIAKNLVIDFYRKRGRTEVISADQIPIIDPGPRLEDQIAITSDFEQVKASMANLKEDYQNVIVWSYIDDLPISEVAKMMDKTEETTRVTLHRALKALKNEIKNKYQTS